MSVLISKGIAVPVLGKLLSDFSHGEVVKLTENGTPVEFYVAKHDYESDLNGTGRTLLVRKDCYDLRNWHSSNVNAYATSDISTWLNGDYMNLFDEKTRLNIGTTSFYYTVGKGDDTVTSLTRSIFLLSMTELGCTETYWNEEGSVLPIASILRIAYYNGSAQHQWTRTPNIRNTTNSSTTGYYVNSSGKWGMTSNFNSWTLGSRPCFTFPANALFDPETLLFKGVK